MIDKMTRTEFRTMLVARQGFTFEEATQIIKAMKWEEADEAGKNFFQIVTRMGKAIVR